MCDINPLLSADRCSDGEDDAQYGVELLNNFTPSGLPPHKLYIEVNQPVMLLRTLDQSVGAQRHMFDSRSDSSQVLSV